MQRAQSIEFEIPKGPGAMRSANGGAVEALDAALAASMGGANVLHGFDPRRIVAFAAGGPPVWSVAFASRDGHHQFLTYGLSRAVDPASPFPFELALRVRDPNPAPMWPVMLLRSIARYHFSTGRVIAPGQFIDLGGPISQAPVTPAERHTMPTTHMTAIMTLGGATIPTPHGPIALHNVLGIDARECELLQSCRAESFMRELAKRNPGYVVALDGPSLADDATFVGAIEEAARREGSDCQAVCVPGLRWADDGSAFDITIPAEHAGRLRRRILSRLPFGQGLLAHTDQPGPGGEILFLPAASVDVPEADERRLTLEVPHESPYVSLLADGNRATWKLRY
ncbi:MAG TPA: suppressor of fused domain protein [Polyangiaceae bacterium]|jgi:hypothetical protein